MGMNLLIYIEKILDKLQSILHTLAGWVVAILLFLADFIVGHELAVGLVVFVTLMDALWGITVSIKKKRFALSELAHLHLFLRTIPRYLFLSINRSMRKQLQTLIMFILQPQMVISHGRCTLLILYLV